MLNAIHLAFVCGLSQAVDEKRRRGMKSYMQTVGRAASTSANAQAD
jgi:hypothetical protein